MKVQIPLLACVLLAGCASTVPLEPPYDPLPALFPVVLDYPRNVIGFELREDRPDVDPAVGRVLTYLDPASAGLRIEVQVRFAGAYVDGSEALADQWPGTVGQIDALLAADSLQVRTSLSDRRRSIRTGGEAPPREGRSLRLEVQSDAGDTQVLAHDLYFVDPYLLDLRSRYPAADASSSGRRIDDFAAALVTALKPSPEVLCDPRVQVLKVRSGLSNVSSNGRVIFVSTQTDHVDSSTVAELQRAATRQRERVGCPPGAQDFSTVEAQMRRRARVR